MNNLVVAASKLAEVVQEFKVVGLLAGTLEQLEGVRKGSGEGRRPTPGLLPLPVYSIRETMTCC